LSRWPLRRAIALPAIGRSLVHPVPPDGIAVLRMAFDRASTECPETYRGVELRACLAGAWGAHLRALDIAVAVEEPERTGPSPRAPQPL
jgi:hypothetical protein